MQIMSNKIKINGNVIELDEDMVKVLVKFYYFYRLKARAELEEFANKSPITKALNDSIQYRDSGIDLAKIKLERLMDEISYEEDKENIGEEENEIWFNIKKI